MQKKDCVQIKFCRLCNSKNLKKVIDLGRTPLANAYSKVKISKKLKRYPLGLKYCFNCGHLQLTHSIKPSKMFSNYLYKTNTSKKNFLHFKKYADEIKQKYKSNGGKILDASDSFFSSPPFQWLLVFIHGGQVQGDAMILKSAPATFKAS